MSIDFVDLYEYLFQHYLVSILWISIRVSVWYVYAQMYNLIV